LKIGNAVTEFAEISIPTFSSSSVIIVVSAIASILVSFRVSHEAAEISSISRIKISVVVIIIEIRILV